MSRPSAQAPIGPFSAALRAKPFPGRLARVGRPARIAVFRALQLGDLLCAVPALRALRLALPDSRVVLIGLPWAASFVRRFHRYIDGFLAFPGYPGLPECTPDLPAIPSFLADAQRERFDLAIQLHGSGEITNPVAVLLGARATTGFFRPGEFCPDPDRFVAYPDDEPEPRRLLHLVRFLGVPPRGEHLEFPLDTWDRREARDALANRAIAGPYVCVHPGARAPERRWPPEAFARVADAIARRGLSVVLTGVAEEASLTADVARHMEQPAVDLAGTLSLGGLAALVAGARLTLSNDTGVSHIAASVGAPSVIVYTASDPSRWAPLDRKRHRVVSALRDGEGAGRAGSSQAAAFRTSDVERPAVEQAIAEAHDLLRAEGADAA